MMPNPTPNGMPGMGAMNDTLDFVKKLWGGMSVPGMVAPTVSVDELQQKIADLKAVESWLNLNLTMLRNTIQALEIQSATLATIQSMGTAMRAAMKPGEDGAPAFPFSPFPSADANAASADGQPAQFSYANWPTPAQKPGNQNTDAATQQGNSGAEGLATASGTDASAGSNSAPQDFSAAMAIPSAWWNVLQNQFLQAVGQASAESPPPGAGEAAPAAGDDAHSKPKSNAKPAAKTSETKASGETKPAGTRKPRT